MPSFVIIGQISRNPLNVRTLQSCLHLIIGVIGVHINKLKKVNRSLRVSGKVLRLLNTFFYLHKKFHYISPLTMRRNFFGQRNFAAHPTSPQLDPSFSANHWMIDMERSMGTYHKTKDVHWTLQIQKCEVQITKLSETAQTKQSKLLKQRMGGDKSSIVQIHFGLSAVSNIWISNKILYPSHIDVSCQSSCIALLGEETSL